MAKADRVRDSLTMGFMLMMDRKSFHVTLVNNIPLGKPRICDLGMR